MSEFKFRSEDIHYQNLCGCVTNFGNSRTYKLCKIELKIPWFLTQCGFISKNYTTLVKLRGGLLHIDVNDGLRYENILHGDRLRKQRTSGEIR